MFWHLLRQSSGIFYASVLASLNILASFMSVFWHLLHQSSGIFYASVRTSLNVMASLTSVVWHLLRHGSGIFNGRVRQCSGIVFALFWQLLCYNSGLFSSLFLHLFHHCSGIFLVPVLASFSPEFWHTLCRILFLITMSLLQKALLRNNIGKNIW